MNTEKMSHVVSMTANVGVLIGLSLLVYELNQNNQHLQEQAETVALQTRIEGIRTLVRNPEIRRFAYSHLEDQPLTESEKLVRIDWFSSMFAQWQWEFERERIGLVDQYASDDHMALLFRTVLGRMQGEDAWRQRRTLYQPDFREFMDTQVIGPG